MCASHIVAAMRGAAGDLVCLWLAGTIFTVSAVSLSAIPEQHEIIARLSLAASIAAPSRVHSQEIPRDESINHLPIGLPRLVQQNAARVNLSFYGDVNSVENLDDTFQTVRNLSAGSHIRRHDFTFGIVVAF
jgi:hypothetical protein